MFLGGKCPNQTARCRRVTNQAIWSSKIQPDTLARPRSPKPGDPSDSQWAFLIGLSTGWAHPRPGRLTRVSAHYKNLKVFVRKKDTIYKLGNWKPLSPSKLEECTFPSQRLQKPLARGRIHYHNQLVVQAKPKIDTIFSRKENWRSLQNKKG